MSSGKWTRYWNIKPNLPCLLLQCSMLTTKHALLTFKDWLEGSCPGDICVGCKDILWGQPSVYYQHYRKEAFKLNLSNKNPKRNYPLGITNTHNLVCNSYICRWQYQTVHHTDSKWKITIRDGPPLNVVLNEIFLPEFWLIVMKFCACFLIPFKILFFVHLSMLNQHTRHCNH